MVLEARRSSADLESRVELENNEYVGGVSDQCSEFRADAGGICKGKNRQLWHLTTNHRFQSNLGLKPEIEVMHYGGHPKLTSGEEINS